MSHSQDIESTTAPDQEAAPAVPDSETESTSTRPPGFYRKTENRSRVFIDARAAKISLPQDAWEARKALRNADLDDDLLIASYALHPKMRVRELVASMPVAPIILAGIVVKSDSHPSVRTAALRNPNLGLDMVAGIILAQRPDLHLDLLKNPNITGEIIEKMISHTKDLKVRKAIAAHPSTPIESLYELATDWDLQNSVAHNPSADLEILSRLAMIRPDLARAISLHPNTHVHTLCFLAVDRNAWDLILDRHPIDDDRTAVHLVLRAATDRDVDILEQLSNQLEFNQEGFSDFHDALLFKSGRVPHVRAKFAARADLPRDHLMRLSHDKNQIVRAAAAANPSLPPERLADLLEDTQQQVRQGALSNPKIISAAAEHLRARKTPQA